MRKIMSVVLSAAAFLLGGTVSSGLAEGLAEKGGVKPARSTIT